MKPQITSSFPVPRRRRIAPLKPAPDAELIDTTGFAVGEVVDYIVKKVQAGTEEK